MILIGVYKENDQLRYQLGEDSCFFYDNGKDITKDTADKDLQEWLKGELLRKVSELDYAKLISDIV